jgi:hypothetical protein
MRALALSMTGVLVTAAILAAPLRADTESVLSELNRKSGEERLKALIEGARKERVLSFYGSAPLGTAQDVLKAFNTRYPFVEVRYTRLGAPSTDRTKDYREIHQPYGRPAARWLSR